ncbi:MAG: RDD family protein [Bacilli bacterium]
MEQSDKLYNYVGIFKRICSSLIDIIFVLFLIVGLYKIVLDPIMNNCTDLSEVTEKYNQKLASTHLFVIDGTTYQLIDEENYANNLEYYYHTYLQGINDLEPGEKYDEDRLNSGLFYRGEDSAIYERNDVLQSSLDSFYEEQYEKAVTYAKQDEELNSYAKKMNLYNYLEFFISLFLSCFVVLFCVPVWILPGGKTLGKLCLGISVLNSKENILCSKKQLAIRQASLLIVELGLSMILMFIPLFITIGMVVFSSNKIALHDYFALTYIIDDKGSVTFKTKEELQQYLDEKNKPYYKDETYTNIKK